MDEYRVHCGRDYASDVLGIWIRDRHGNVWRDGTWEETEPAVQVEPSVSIPGSLAPDFARAIAEWHHDRTFDPRTEAKVLREALAVERQRVDRILGR